ncbi:hypothetical protein, partial [Pseudomonas savastanoi]|uniref:hypothetical protein n=1 Tax=Pseudomonas savastanoi TaxID=29438 RepID=UPI001EE6ECC8
MISTIVRRSASHAVPDAPRPILYMRRGADSFIPVTAKLSEYLLASYRYYKGFPIEHKPNSFCLTPLHMPDRRKEGEGLRYY